MNGLLPEKDFLDLALREYRLVLERLRGKDPFLEEPDPERMSVKKHKEEFFGEKNLFLVPVPRPNHWGYVCRGKDLEDLERNWLESSMYGNTFEEIEMFLESRGL